MKQIWPNYSYSPATNVLTLTGLNIDRDQLLLVTAADRGRIMYNFADSSVTASAFTSGANTALTLVATTAGLTTTAALVIYYDDQLQSTAVSISNFPASQVISGTVTANPTGTQTITGTVTANVFGQSSFNQSVFPIPVNESGNNDNLLRHIPIGFVDSNGESAIISSTAPLPISGSVEVSNTVNIAGPVESNITAAAFINTDDDSITSTKSIKVGWTDPTNDTFLTTSELNPFPVSLRNSVTISSLTALVAGTAQIGSVTASISNSAVTVYPAQGTSVTNSNFTSLTSSTSLVSAVAGRKVLTVFNEGAGNLFISPGATCTTISYQVRLSSGDYWECPQGQLSLAHTAVFATAGTARVCQVS